MENPKNPNKQITRRMEYRFNEKILINKQKINNNISKLCTYS